MVLEAPTHPRVSQLPVPDHSVADVVDPLRNPHAEELLGLLGRLGGTQKVQYFLDGDFYYFFSLPSRDPAWLPHRARPGVGVGRGKGRSLAEPSCNFLAFPCG